MILLLIGYMWLYVHRPFEVWPWLGNLYLERVFILTSSVLWFFFHQKSVVRNINVLGIFCVAAAILFSDFMTNMTDKTNPAVDDWLKILFFAILLLTSIRNEMELKLLLTGFTVIFFFYMLHSYYEFKFCGRYVFRMGIPRLTGMGETMSDPNSFGASIVYFLPVVVPLCVVIRGMALIPIRLFALASVGLAMICIMDTGSRGAFVGLLAYLGLAIAFSKNRWKILAVAIVILPILWISMDERMQNRYLTLIDPSRGPKNAQASAEGRMRGLQDGLMLFRRSPLYGFGPGNAQFFSGSQHQTHNFIGQVAGELGSIGLLAYSFLSCCITINYLYSRFYWKILLARCPTADPYLFLVSQAVFISLILLHLMGMGGHNAFRYTWVWYAAFQGMAVVVLKKKVDDVIREQSECDLVEAEQEEISRQTIPARPASQPI